MLSVFSDVISGMVQSYIGIAIGVVLIIMITIAAIFAIIKWIMAIRKAGKDAEKIYNVSRTTINELGELAKQLHK